MKNIYLMLFVFLSNSSYAQLNLEHSYLYTHTLIVVNIEGYGQKYAIVDTLTNKVHLHNSDHSLWKTINTFIPNGGKFISISCISSKLFNNDEMVELAFCYKIKNGSSEIYITRIVNEKGANIDVLYGVHEATPVHINGEWKLKATVAGINKYNIYSLSGSYLLSSNEEHEIESIIYPNPFSTSAVIKYHLPKDKKNGIIRITDSYGKFIKEYYITDKFNNISIQRGDLPSGNYLYSIISEGELIDSKKFTIL